jgi:ABC-type sugar transport system ATPase subunit
MNILSGAIAPDDGDLSINGETVRFDDPHEAQAAGIATIHQELDRVPTLDVAASVPWTRARPSWVSGQGGVELDPVFGTNG